MTTTNVCREESCLEVIPQHHYLCYPHWQAERRGTITRCPECDYAYKSEQRPLCIECDGTARAPAVQGARDNTDLSALEDEIKRIQDTITRDAYIHRSETRTRDGVITPLLKALGWDITATHPMIISEYRVGFRRVDYALLSPPGVVARPIAFVEAKRMQEDLSDDHLDQVLRYAAIRKSVKYAILTNGDRWKCYDVSEEASPRLIVDVSIRLEFAHDCAAKLQSLMQSSLGRSEAYSLGNSDSARPVPARPTQTDEILVPNHVETPRSVPTPRVTVLPANSGVDVGKVLAWFGTIVVVWGLASYIVGFVIARPVFGAFSGVGAIIVGIVAIAAVALTRSHWLLPWGRFGDLLWRPVEGDVGGTRIWLAVATCFGGGTVCVLGIVTGLLTAQFISDALTILGSLVIAVVIAVVAGAIVLRGGRSSKRSRR